MADNDDIPFNRDFPLKPGVVEEVAPRRAALLCNNPSPFTFTGTVSYIVGRGKVAIIDPGPDDEAHASGAARRRARRDGDAYPRHPHPPRPFAEHRADQGGDRRAVYAEGPHRASRPRFESEKHSPESGADRDFRPDIEVANGDVDRGRTAGRWKRWRRPATPPTTWRSPGRSEASVSSAIT